MKEVITLAHGSGGRKTSELIGEIFRKNLGNEYFTADDAAVLPKPEGRIAMSTDGFIVSPAFFAGGNIGKLSICGTVNDLACMGAVPAYLTGGFVIEEGFPMSKLEEIAAAMPAGQMFFTLMAFFLITTGFTATIVAQFHGANDRVGCVRAAWNGFYSFG